MLACSSKQNHRKTHPNAPTTATKPWESTPPWGIIKSKPQSSTEANLSDITSKIDGKSLGEMLQAWRDAAASYERINSLETLSKKKIGLREVEQFGLGLR